MDIIKRKCKIVRLETSNISPILEEQESRKLFLNSKHIFNTKGHKNQHLYIISNDEIKEGDLFYNATIGNTGIFTCKDIDNLYIQSKELGNFGINHNSKYCNKIIASTDPSLGLPSISQGFIEKYCQLGGIDKVMVEYNRFTWNTRTNNEQCYFGYEAESEMQYCIEVIQPKLNSKGEVIISKIKDSWNREEVIELCKSAYKEGINYEMGIGYSINKWIKENL